jgi:hypothetical protein
MNMSSERSTSLWMSTSVLDDASTLDRDEKADVVVVGSSIAGLILYVSGAVSERAGRAPFSQPPSAS